MVGVGGAEDDPGGGASMRHHHLPDPPLAAEALEKTRALAADQGE